MSDNKPPMFGATGVIDQAADEPRAGKSPVTQESMAQFAGNPAVAETIIGNRTTTIPLKFDFDGANRGHALRFGPTLTGMSSLLLKLKETRRK